MIKFKKCQIVAEGCDNHFGKLSNAKKMVDLAKKAMNFFQCFGLTGTAELGGD